MPFDMNIYLLAILSIFFKQLYKQLNRDHNKTNHSACWREADGDPSVVRSIKSCNDLKVYEVSTSSPHDDRFTRGQWTSFKATETRFTSRQIRRGLQEKKPVSIFFYFHEYFVYSIQQKQNIRNEVFICLFIRAVKNYTISVDEKQFSLHNLKCLSMFL